MGKILLFYKYVTLENPKRALKWQKQICANLGLTGRIILAREGINGTVGGTVENTERYKQIMESNELFSGIDFKEGEGGAHSFPRMRIVVKNEIVNLGVDPEKITVKDTGVHLKPEETHELLENKPENLVILDTRNTFESRIGTFEGAIRPDLRYFREFPEYIDKNLDQFKDKKVLMYCTGGVRCERATAYLKSKDVAQEVYQVEGGIHRYAEKFPDGHFRGKNYVFDNRIATAVNDDILGSCDVCEVPCDTYQNCLNALCNKHYIGCTDCVAKLNNTCSETCMELVRDKKVHQRPPRVSCQ